MDILIWQQKDESSKGKQGGKKVRRKGSKKGKRVGLIRKASETIGTDTCPTCPRESEDNSVTNSNLSNEGNVVEVKE